MKFNIALIAVIGQFSKTLNATTFYLYQTKAIDSKKYSKIKTWILFLFFIHGMNLP